MRAGTWLHNYSAGVCGQKLLKLLDKMLQIRLFLEIIKPDFQRRVPERNRDIVIYRAGIEDNRISLQAENQGVAVFLVQNMQPRTEPGFEGFIQIVVQNSRNKDVIQAQILKGYHLAFGQGMILLNDGMNLGGAQQDVRHMGKISFLWVDVKETVDGTIFQGGEQLCLFHSVEEQKFAGVCFGIIGGKTRSKGVVEPYAVPDVQLLELFFFGLSCGFHRVVDQIQDLSCAGLKNFACGCQRTARSCPQKKRRADFILQRIDLLFDGCRRDKKLFSSLGKTFFLADV